MVIRHGDAVAGESDGGASTRVVRALNAADEGQKEHVRCVLTRRMPKWNVATVATRICWCGVDEVSTCRGMLLWWVLGRRGRAGGGERRGVRRHAAGGCQGGGGPAREPCVGAPGAKFSCLILAKSARCLQL